MNNPNIDPDFFKAASNVQLRDLFVRGMYLATYCDPHGRPEHGSGYYRRGDRIVDTTWGVHAYVRRLQHALPQQAVTTLGISGMFMIDTRGDIELRGHRRFYRPESCTLFVDIPKPDGYGIDSFYTRVYRFAAEAGEVNGHSAIIEDYIPPDETAESWMEARELERLTGVITVAEYKALKSVMGALRLYLARRRAKVRPRPAVSSARKHLILPHIRVA